VKRRGGDAVKVGIAASKLAGSGAVAGAVDASHADARAAIAALQGRNPLANPLGVLPDVHPAKIPAHIAIIMDGNGRWANQQGFPRELGHRAGAGSVRTIVEACYELGVEVLTLYSFSLENWKRPKDEVDALMQLCIMYLEGERDEMMRRNIRLRVIGQREGLPQPVLDAIDRVSAATAKNTAFTLCLAINYGARAELVDAARALAREVASGTRDPASIDEAALAGKLTTAGLPDPDLLIRTAGEMRVSNFLLWQISYAELHVTQTLWPDFGPGDLHAAVRDFSQRNRKFGGLSQSV
jgi:undecaprenyl diphosphate synthase